MFHQQLAHFPDAPQKSPWHRPHKHREQQKAPAGVCMKSCSWRDFQKQLHCHTFDLFPNQERVVGLFCLYFFPFSCHPFHSHKCTSQNFCPACFSAAMRYLKPDWQAKYLQFLSIHQLFKGVICFSSQIK